MMLDTTQRASLEEAARHVQAELLRVLEATLPREGVEPQIIWRVKSDASIQRKLAMRGEIATADAFINDLLGFRIIVSHTGLLTGAVTTVRRWLVTRGRFHLTNERDYFSDPRTPFYRSIHIDALLTEGMVDGRAKAGVEFQITTYMQNYLAAISHDLRYEPRSSHHLVETRLLDEIVRNVETVDAAVAAAFSKR